jgi:hypothetical protein
MSELESPAQAVEFAFKITAKTLKRSTDVVLRGTHLEAR